MDEAELSRAFPIGDGACLEAVIGRYGQALLRTAIISCVTTMRPRTRCRTRCCGPGVGGTASGRVPIWRRGSTSWPITPVSTCSGKRRRQLFAPPPPSGHNPDYIGPELRAALSVLTPEERGLVFGRVMEGRSYEELSQIYGPSAAALAQAIRAGAEEAGPGTERIGIG